MNNHKEAKRSGSVSCFGGHSSTSTTKFKHQPSHLADIPSTVQPGVITIEGELLKQGKKTDMWVKRYFVLKDSCLLSFYDSSCKGGPISKLNIMRFIVL